MRPGLSAFKNHITLMCIHTVLQPCRSCTEVPVSVMPQEAKYVERWPNTTSAWSGWSRFDIPVDRYGGVHSQLISTSITLGFATCHQASQQDNTYWTKYQKADQASTLLTLWLCRWVMPTFVLTNLHMYWTSPAEMLNFCRTADPSNRWLNTSLPYWNLAVKYIGKSRIE